MSESGTPLPEPATQLGRDGLAALLAAPGQAVLALDFDGTLAPIVARPQDAVPAPGAVDALIRLAAACRTVALVSGRPASTIVACAGLADTDPIVVLGHYGLERWQAGALTTPQSPPGVATARAELPALVGDYGEVEDKGHSLAVHTRGATDPEGSLAALADPLAELAERAGLVVEPGRLVLELRPPGVDKGAALRRLVAESDASAVLYGGDDLGDLAAFDAVEAMRAEGLPGLTVCSAIPEAVPAVRERADLVLDGPVAVVALLEGLARRVGNHRPR